MAKKTVKALSKASLETLSVEVVKGITPVVNKKVEKLHKDFVVKNEAAIKKNTKTGDLEAGVQNAIYEGDMRFIKAIPKQERLAKMAKAFMALSNKDSIAVKEYNVEIEARREKAGYANTGTDADGGYIALDPEFEVEIEKLSEEYGVALREANIRQLNSGSVKTNKRGSNVSMSEVGQGATISGTKLTIEHLTEELRKFAGIAISTNEMTEDQAVDLMASWVEGFAEERARITDTLVFTDSNPLKPGLLHAADTIVETVGANITDLTWDDLMNAEAAVPTKVRKNGKFYMHRTVWNIVTQTKDDNNRYQYFPAMGLKTPWGTDVVLVDVMPDSATVGDGNEGFIIFGDLKRTPLYIKKGLRFDESVDATVTDADSTTIKLFEQDMGALRAIFRASVLHKFPEAYCIIGTGTVS